MLKSLNKKTKLIGIAHQQIQLSFLSVVVELVEHIQVEVAVELAEHTQVELAEHTQVELVEPVSYTHLRAHET